jgi:hypothetical protein
MENVENIKGVKSEVVINKNGVIHLLAATAFQQFEKKPRQRAKIVLNILFNKASDRGYGSKVKFEKQFRAAQRDIEAERTMIRDFSGYLSREDIATALTI